MDKKVLTEKIKKKLDEVGLSQAWAARQLGVTPAYFNRIVTGGLPPGDELFAKMGTLLTKLNSSGLSGAV